MSEWEFEHSSFTKARRKDAWAFWSDMRNHAEMEPGVERIELDGPFVTGTKGRTIGTGFRQEWELTEVVERRRFVIIGFTPEGDGALSFAWEFEDEGMGTRMTQRIAAYGPQVEKHREDLHQMEVNAPKAMARLVSVLDGLAPSQHGDPP